MGAKLSVPDFFQAHPEGGASRMFFPKKPVGASVDEADSQGLARVLEFLSSNILPGGSLEEAGSRSPCRAFRNIGPPKELVELVSSCTAAEEKLRCAIGYMEGIVEGAHPIKVFGAARRFCLGLFQAAVASEVRNKLWVRYGELCREARRLKELQDEQALFKCEQLERAIQEVDRDFSSMPERAFCLTAHSCVEEAFSLKDNRESYQNFSHALQHLNGFATRLAALKKKALKAAIQRHQRRRILDSLHIVGDRIHPKRKEVIRQLSALFAEDVEGFVRQAAPEGKTVAELFSFKAEIKLLQKMSKEFTLGTDVFNKARVLLSECWGRITDEVLRRRKARCVESLSVREKHAS